MYIKDIYTLATCSASTKVREKKSLLNIALYLFKHHVWIY